MWPYLELEAKKKRKKNQSWEYSEVVGCLPGMFNAIGSNPEHGGWGREAAKLASIYGA